MKRATNSPEAYRLYLDAKYLLDTRRGLEARELAKKNLNTAIRLDPNFALAYTILAGMEADAPTQESYQRMKILAKKALDVDENLKEARVIYAMAIWRGDWSWTEAEKQIEILNRLEAKDWGDRNSDYTYFNRTGKIRESARIYRIEIGKICCSAARRNCGLLLREKLRQSRRTES